MRDLMKALSDLETQLITTYGITLNEAMVLCSVGNNTVSAGDITSSTGMTPSHASKTIRSVESKDLLTRKLGEHDKRQMYFVLTGKGKKCLEEIKEKGVEVPGWLKGVFGEKE